MHFPSRSWKVSSRSFAPSLRVSAAPSYLRLLKKQTSSSKAKSSNYSLFQNFVFQKNVYVAKRLDSIPVLQMPACTIGDSIASTSTSSMRCNSCMHQKTKRLAATFKLMWMIFVVLSTYIDSQSSCSLRNWKKTTQIVSCTSFCPSFSPSKSWKKMKKTSKTHHVPRPLLP